MVKRQELELIKSRIKIMKERRTNDSHENMYIRFSYLIVNSMRNVKNM